LCGETVSPSVTNGLWYFSTLDRWIFKFKISGEFNKYRIPRIFCKFYFLLYTFKTWV